MGLILDQRDNYIKSLQIERFFILSMTGYQNFLDGRYGTWSNLISRAKKLYDEEALETGTIKRRDDWIKIRSAE